MKIMVRLIAFLAALLPSLATAQVPNFNLPPQTVVGRSAGITGPAQAIPWSQLTGNLCSVFSLSQKGCVPPPGSSTGRYLGDDAAWHAQPTQQIIAGTGVSTVGTCSGSALNCTVNATSATQLVYASRATAASLNLSPFSTIQTLGYAAAGDGGGATFQKITGNFIDTRILTGSITNNGTSGCTNNTYFGIPFSGGSGRGAYAQVTVSGNVVTSVIMGGQSTAGYAAGDVLTASVTGCATTVSWTVSTVTTPTGSFTDAAGNKWQIVFPAAGLDARSMGVKFDWDGNDGAATDNWTTLQNTFSFASYLMSTIVDLGGSLGGQVLLPKNTAMFCGDGTTPLMVPLGVKGKGQGNYTTVLKPCDTWPTNSHVIYLCDPFTHFACFGTMLEDLQIFTQRDVGGTTNTATIYTNNAQHEAGLRNVVIYPGACKIGVYLDQGFGGATYITLDNVEVKGGKSMVACGGVDNPSVKIAYGTTQVWVKNLVPGGLSASFSGPRQTGVAITGGFVTIQGFHPEQIIDPILINIPGGLASGQVRLFGLSGGVDCVGLVTLSGTNTPGNFMIGPPNALNGCTRLVTNGQPSGSNLTGPVMIDTIFNP